MIDNFSDDKNVGGQGYKNPNMHHPFLSEMLRFESLRLEVQILTLVLILVSNIIPEVLTVSFNQIGFGNAAGRSGPDVVGG